MPRPRSSSRARRRSAADAAVACGAGKRAVCERAFVRCARGRLEEVDPHRRLECGPRDGGRAAVAGVLGTTDNRLVHAAPRLAARLAGAGYVEGHPGEGRRTPLL
jgi:hypothetical protein